jgi:hypothetical protein
MMQQNLVSGKTKLADSRLLLFKITSVFARSCAWWWFAGYQMLPGYRMVPRYQQILVYTGYRSGESLSLVNIMLMCYTLHHLVQTNMNWLCYWLNENCLLHPQLVVPYRWMRNDLVYEASVKVHALFWHICIK